MGSCSFKKGSFTSINRPRNMVVSMLPSVVAARFLELSVTKLPPMGSHCVSRKSKCTTDQKSGMCHSSGVSRCRNNNECSCHTRKVLAEVLKIGVLVQKFGSQLVNICKRLCDDDLLLNEEPDSSSYKRQKENEANKIGAKRANTSCSVKNSRVKLCY